MFELGFSISSGLFSCPGLLAEMSLSALRVSCISCACAVIPANAAVASAVELTPKKFLRDRSAMDLFSFRSLTDCLLHAWLRSRLGLALISRNLQSRFIFLILCTSSASAAAHRIRCVCNGFFTSYRFANNTICFGDHRLAGAVRIPSRGAFSSRSKAQAFERWSPQQPLAEVHRSEPCLRAGTELAYR